MVNWGTKGKYFAVPSLPTPPVSPFHLLKTLIFFSPLVGGIFYYCLDLAWGGRLEAGGMCVCTESIQGVVISAFHFAVQLERSRFQIHPHTGTAREESAGREGAAQGGWGSMAGTMAWALGALANLTGNGPQPLPEGRRCLCPVLKPCRCLAAL